VSTSTDERVLCLTSNGGSESGTLKNFRYNPLSPNNSLSGLVRMCIETFIYAPKQNVRGDKQVRDLGQCPECGKEHREWFEVEAEKESLRRVDECFQHDARAGLSFPVLKMQKGPDSGCGMAAP
jgi:hypothetical protein